jgi:hypothetical protein
LLLIVLEHPSNPLFVPSHGKSTLTHTYRRESLLRPRVVLDPEHAEKLHAQEPGGLHYA